MKRSIPFFVLLLCVVFIYACSSKAPSESLKRIYNGDNASIDPSIITTLSMDDLGADAETYLGAFIETEGLIKTLCPVGCFFFIEDNDRNRFYVNLSPNNFDVPQAALGERVRVMGVLERRGTLLAIMAFEVEFLDVNP